MTKLEAVAQAIADGVEKVRTGEFRDMDDVARAAVEAMREPSYGMFIAGVAFTAATMEGQDVSFPMIWENVLDAILNEKPDA